CVSGVGKGRPTWRHRCRNSPPICPCCTRNGISWIVSLPPPKTVFVVSNTFSPTIIRRQTCEPVCVTAGLSKRCSMRCLVPGLAAWPGREAEFRVSIEKALEYANTLACPAVHVMAGIVPADAERQMLLERYQENLAWAAGLARQAGVSLLLEPINTRDMPGYFL